MTSCWTDRVVSRAAVPLAEPHRNRKTPSVIHEPELTPSVRAAMTGADEDTIHIVAAIAGLLGAVAYADGVYEPAEAHQVREELGRIRGLSPTGIRTILAVLERKLVELSTIDVVRSARALRELGDRDLRREVLEVLLRMAAADGTISTREVTTLRQITGALGLQQSDYNSLQEQYRDLLEILHKPGPA